MRRTLPLLATLLCIVAFALPSQAGRIDIDFDFSGSSISILGGSVNIPPDGTITSASGQIGVPGSGLVTASSGAGARFRDLTLDATLDATLATFGVTLTGGAQATQLGGGNGSLSAGLGNLVFGNMQLSLAVAINCMGSTAVCSALSLPLATTGPQTLALGTIPISGLGTVGAGAVNGSFSITLAGFTAVLNLVGTEVSRTFIPEPNTFGLVALGLAGLAGMRSLRRR